MIQRLARYPLLALAVALAGGCTPVYVTSTGPVQYAVRGTSPYGLYGGLIDLSPSESEVMATAEKFCPEGYDKTAETGRNWVDGKYLEWHIRCHARASSN